MKIYLIMLEAMGKERVFLKENETRIKKKIARDRPYFLKGWNDF